MRWSILVAGMMPLAPLAAAPTAAETFENEVRPLLVEHCLECHGDQKPKGGLKLTSRALILKGGDSGPAAVPGKAKDSLLIQVLAYKGGDALRMPPKGKLPDAAIARLAKWIDAGAEWPDAGPAAVAGTFKITDAQRQFWAFQPVKMPPVPAVNGTAATDIDRFLLAKLEAAGLTLAPSTDKRTLIRRATFDLTGLPPTPAEVAAFLKDNAADAFAKVVDRLLASDAYGERWARHWLDVVRYADSRDSRGQGSDGDILEAWRYRDWVVRALNADLPYDEFIRLQVAGDLMPPRPNFDHLVATGLLTIGEWGTGDADKEKMVTDIVNDQVDVVTRSFLGLTVGCARCHDHKFDPISAKDYYALAGIFFSTRIIPEPGAKTAGSPMLRTPLLTKEEAAAREARTKRAKELEILVKQTTDKHAAAFAKEQAGKTVDHLMAAWDYRRLAEPRPPIAEFAASRGLTAFALRNWSEVMAPRAYRLMTVGERDSRGTKGLTVWRGGVDCPNALVNGSDQELQLSTFKLPPKSVSIHPGPTNGVAVAWESPMAGKVAATGKLVDRDGTCGDGIAWRVDVRRGNAATVVASGIVGNGGTFVLPADKLAGIEVRKGDRIELLVLPSREYTCDTTYVEFEIADGPKKWNLTGDLLASNGANPSPDQQGNANVWSFLDMADAKGVPASLAGTAVIAAATDREAALNAAKSFAFSFKADDPASPFRPGLGDESVLPEAARAELKALRDEQDEIRRNPPPPVQLALAARDGGVPGSMFPAVQDVPVHIRGSYTRLGEVVPRRFPEIIAGADQKPLREVTKQSGRLELAAFLSDAKNPLTARVMVNRVWAWHFGDGLVRTPGNFGQLGERPTHPELLDHLAATFVADGWSLKKLHRRLMLTAAYQQSSRSASSAKDPDNRLWGRQNPRRLEAEAVRDSLLAVAGRLDRTAGGVSYINLNTPRRTLYLRTVRSDKSNYQALFDAADPETPTDKRTVSTVAPQALFLLNHPFAVARGKELAARIKAMPGDDAARLDATYELLYARPPTDAERGLGLEFVKSAGWEAFAPVLICANEFVYVD